MVKAQPDPPPRPECDICRDALRCVMRAAVCRELMIAWIEGRTTEGCPLFESDNYHGLEGCYA